MSAPAKRRRQHREGFSRKHRFAHEDPKDTIEELREQNVELLHRLAKCECGQLTQSGGVDVGGGTESGTQAGFSSRALTAASPAVDVSAAPDVIADLADPDEEIVLW